MKVTRRGVIAGSGLALAAAPLSARADSVGRDAIAADLDRYVGFGNKAAGGSGDNDCGAWLDEELTRSGYRVARQAFDAPWFSATHATLTTGESSAPVLPLAVVVPTPAGGASGRLVRIDPASGPAAPLRGAIALLDLPFGRWSTALAKPIADPVAAAFAAGAAAVVIVTNGPTGEAIALNARGDRPMFAGPVALLAPRQARPFLIAAAAGALATLRIEGSGGVRPAFNLVGRIDRGKPTWLAVSTPRSGWTSCAGERGPGLVAWLALARWAARAVPGHNLAFLCNSGHEYEYLGAEKALAEAAPPPAATALWLHLGANVAARDWHEPGGGMLLPLPSADPQRFLVATPDILTAARGAFVGLAGLEATYPARQGTAGELSNILAAGYPHAAGIFGAHRFHHVAGDDARCVDAALIAPVIRACEALIAQL